MRLGELSHYKNGSLVTFSDTNLLLVLKLIFSVSAISKLNLHTNV